jgi:cytochrome P450
LSYLVVSGELDDTALGNLIYMFESAHFDIYSLWHWIVKQLVSNPRAAERFREAAAAGGVGRSRMARAIVLETLRLEQSEVLYRVPTCDIIFDGFLIPKRTVVRACLWEGHKDAQVFADPFKFDPDRFLTRDYDMEEFAPFGLDKRRCIAADFVVKASAAFVEILLTGFTLKMTSDGPPRKGPYHWEPSSDLSIVISEGRKAKSTASAQPQDQRHRSRE